jgi:putative ABC transport system ATP-binding protein
MADQSLYTVQNLAKTYQMGEVVVNALRGVDLTIEKGKFIVILGHSGSGKSTLLNIMGGLDTASEGDITFRGEPLSTYSESQLTQYRRKNIGFIFQFYNLMPNLTAKENVEMATEISVDPMDPLEALERVGLKDRADHFPAQLSGGEQQRVAIARAIAKRPDILMCDEPTGALDISTGKVVLQVLADINKEMGTTLIVITHNASIAEIGNMVVRMKDGQVHKIIHHDTLKSVEEVEW